MGVVRQTYDLPIGVTKILLFPGDRYAPSRGVQITVSGEGGAVVLRAAAAALRAFRDAHKCSKRRLSPLYPLDPIVVPLCATGDFSGRDMLPGIFRPQITISATRERRRQVNIVAEYLEGDDAGTYRLRTKHIGRARI